MPAISDSSGQDSGRYEPTGAGCLLGFISLLIVMSAEVILVEVLLTHKEHVATAIDVLQRQAFRRRGWFGGGVLALNALAIAAGVVCFKLGSLLLRACGISVWKPAAGDAADPTKNSPA